LPDVETKKPSSFGGRLSFGLFYFTPYDYLPPGIFPVVVDVVDVVLLLIIYNVCKESRYFFKKQALLKISNWYIKKYIYLYIIKNDEKYFVKAR